MKQTIIGTRKIDEDYAVAKKIKNLRIENGSTQSDVAKYIGITLQQMQKYENCKNRISAGKLYLLSRFFNVEIQDFFSEIDSDTEIKIGKLTKAEQEQLKALNKSYISIKDADLRLKIVNFVKSMKDK
jgi:transcriptional regulator with XRE-family HTH domain